jgi:hypothetical protein
MQINSVFAVPQIFDVHVSFDDKRSIAYRVKGTQESKSIEIDVNYCDGEFTDQEKYFGACYVDYQIKSGETHLPICIDLDDVEGLESVESVFDDSILMQR